MTFEQLNADRRRKGLRPLTREEAKRLLAQHAPSVRHDDDDDAAIFAPLGGLMESIIDSSLSGSFDSGQSIDTSSPIDAGGGSFGGGGADGSW